MPIRKDVLYVSFRRSLGETPFSVVLHTSNKCKNFTKVVMSLQLMTENIPICHFK